jgi:hypothetical protein
MQSCSSCPPLIDWPRRHASKRSSVVADRRSLIALDAAHRSTIDSATAAQLAAPIQSQSANLPAALESHRACRTSPAHHARFPPLEAFGRRPPEYAAPPPLRPASETLHKTGLTHAPQQDNTFNHLVTAG